MANTTPTKSPLKSKNLWTGIITILTAVFLGFEVMPDPAAVGVLTDTGTAVVEGIKTKNWLSAGLVLVNSGNIIFHLLKTWFGKQDAK
jgi:hypothetical protein